MRNYELLFTRLDGRSSIREKLHELFAKAVENILIVSHRVGDAAVREYEPELRRFAKRGGHLVLLTSTAHEQRQETALSRLKSVFGDSIDIHVRENIHGKCMVIDGEHTVLMSANFAGDGVGLSSDWSIESHGWDKPAFELGIHLSDSAFAAQVISSVQEILNAQTDE